MMVSSLKEKQWEMIKKSRSERRLKAIYKKCKSSNVSAHSNFNKPSSNSNNNHNNLEKSENSDNLQNPKSSNGTNNNNAMAKQQNNLSNGTVPGKQDFRQSIEVKNNRNKEPLQQDVDENILKDALVTLKDRHTELKNLQIKNIMTTFQSHFLTNLAKKEDIEKYLNQPPEVNNLTAQQSSSSSSTLGTNSQQQSSSKIEINRSDQQVPSPTIATHETSLIIPPVDHFDTDLLNYDSTILQDFYVFGCQSVGHRR